MIRELMHDPLFLARKSTEATKDDLPIARDLLETLTAHRETCVGMAANMIGFTKRIIAFDCDGSYMVMLNPEIINASGEYEPRKAACPCWAAPGKPSAIRRSKSATRPKPSRSV